MCEHHEHRGEWTVTVVQRALWGSKMRLESVVFPKTAISSFFVLGTGQGAVVHAHR